MEDKNHAFDITNWHPESLPHRSVAAMFHLCCSKLVRRRGASGKNVLAQVMEDKDSAFNITKWHPEKKKWHPESLPHRSVAAMFCRYCSELVRHRGASGKNV